MAAELQLVRWTVNGFDRDLGGGINGIWRLIARQQ